jgi:hypothetical protein
MDEHEFIELFNQIMSENKPVDFEYRLYYNKETEEPLFYTMEQPIGDYITVTQKQHSEGRYDLLVRGGNIISLIDAVSWTKLVPSESGTGCRADNVMIVDSSSNIKWATKTYYLQ